MPGQYSGPNYFRSNPLNRNDLGRGWLKPEGSVAGWATEHHRFFIA
jgi:hypothetical protein